MEPEHIPKPTFEMRPRPMYDDLEPNLCDVMQHIDVVQERHRWIMASISSTMISHGMDHPPFSQADPVVPPYTQTRVSDHN